MFFFVALKRVFHYQETKDNLSIMTYKFLMVPILTLISRSESRDIHQKCVLKQFCSFFVLKHKKMQHTHGERMRKYKTFLWWIISIQSPRQKLKKLETNVK